VTPTRPRLLLVDDDHARRLEFTSALSARWDVQPVGLDDDPLRLARSLRPPVVLLALEKARSEQVLRLCRTLRTDLRPIERVGIYEGGARRRGAWIAMELWMADGYLGLPTDGATLAGWVDAVVRGDRPNQAPTRDEGGAMGRLRSLLRRG
jgi:DNA-binding response OmpR family regulator